MMFGVVLARKRHGGKSPWPITGTCSNRLEQVSFLAKWIIVFLNLWDDEVYH